MFVNGDWAVRARNPNTGNFSNGMGYYFELGTNTYPFAINANYIGSWANNGICEMVWISHWTCERSRISNYSSGGGGYYVYFQSPENSFGASINHHPQPTQYCYFENAYELIDTDGEWFLDTGTNLYYKPRAGEDMSTVEVIAPYVEKLINIEGTQSNYTHNIKFYGISFKHDTWLAPNTYGYLDMQGAHCIQITGNSVLTSCNYLAAPGMFDVRYGRNITVERCKFTLGGSWGIMESIGDHNSYIGNVFKDLAAGGICIGNRVTTANWGAEPTGTGGYDIIKNNLVDNIGRMYHDATGIHLLKVNNVTCEHNEVRRTNYTGINVGFEWNDSGAQNSYNNIIAYNRVSQAMRLLDDGGGFYTLGRMDNSVWRYNYIYNLIKSPYTGGAWCHGLYADNGSCYKLFEYNVVDNVWAFAYMQNAPNYSNTVRNNYFNSNNAADFYVSGSNVLQNNIRCIGGAWPAEAVNIMKNSGVEYSYSDIGDVTHGENIALFKPATASSYYGAGFKPELGNDNNSESSMWASDATEPNPWWQVDLGGNYRIFEIDVATRRDYDQVSQRQNFAIRVSNDSNFNTYTQVAVVGGESCFFQGTFSTYVSDTNYYRYVRVQRINNAGHFNFTECRVIAVAAGSMPATKIVCNAEPISIKANGVAIATITAILQDMDGKTAMLSTNTVVFTITGNGTWDDNTTNPKSQIPINGIATIKVKPTTIPGSIMVTANITDPSVQLSSAVTITTIPDATKIIAGVSPSTITADGISIATITATLVNANNNIVQNATNIVTFNISGNGTWDDDTLTPKLCTPINGIATIRAKPTTLSGGFTVTSNATGLTGSTVTVVTIPGVPASILCTSDLANMVADGVSIATVTATILDTYNNVIAESTGPVTFSITGTGGVWESDGTQDNKTIPAANGTATIRVRATTKKGWVDVNARIP